LSTDATDLDPRDVYRRRFADHAEFRDRMWSILCRDFFQRFVPREATVLEIAAGHCEFINNIAAATRIAVDINEDTNLFAAPAVRVVLAPADDLQALADASIDVVFISNFFEHIDKKRIRRVLAECRRVLRPGGKLLVLQPNIRYAWRDYWMFFDHVTPLDDRSLREVIELAGLHVERCIPRFLPFTVAHRPPAALLLLRLYLKLPLLWRLFGQQAFLVARA
jgi:SAM-dependent methyltransferase